MMLAAVLVAGIPLAAFIAWGVFASWWIGRDDPLPVPVPAGCVMSPAPAPFPSSAIPDCTVIAGRIADRAWLDFVAAHDLGGVS